MTDIKEKKLNEILKNNKGKLDTKALGGIIARKEPEKAFGRIIVRKEPEKAMKTAKPKDERQLTSAPEFLKPE